MRAVETPERTIPETDSEPSPGPVEPTNAKAPPELAEFDPMAAIVPGETKLPWLGFARGAALVVTTIGVVVLFGWIAGIEQLTRPFSGASTMKANTALALTFLGVAILSAGFADRSLDKGATSRPRRRVWMMLTLSLAAAAIGLITTIEYLAGVDPGFDNLITGAPPAGAAEYALRPSLMTAVTLTLLGTALAADRLDGVKSVHATQLLAFTATFTAYLAVLSHIYQAEFILGAELRTSVALTTAICLLLTGLAILCLRPFEGWMRIVTIENAGGNVTRRLIPAVALGIPLISLGRVLGTEAGLFDDRFGAALAVTLIALGISAAIIRLAIVMNRQQLDCELAQVERRRTMLLLTGLAEGSSAMIAARDVHGRLLMANSVFERWTGVPRDRALGKTLRETLSPELVPRRERALNRVLETGETVIEEVQLTPGVAVPTVVAETFPVRDESGAIVAVGAICVDITERRLEEEAIERLNRQLAGESERAREAIAELEAFSHTVSHDLRSPLRAIDGFSQVVEAEYADAIDERGRRFLARMRAAAREMHGLIGDLLEYSRVGRGELEFKRLDMTAIAREANERFAHEREGRDVRVTIAELPPAYGDERTLGVVFTQLLSNAYKYTRERAVAEIAVGGIAAAGRPATYFVRDNGVGFDMRFAGKLFEAFERLHHDRTYEGTGVGLATVQRILRRHDGCVWVESELGVGTTIFFQLARDDFAPYPEADHLAEVFSIGRRTDDDNPPHQIAQPARGESAK